MSPVSRTRGRYLAPLVTSMVMACAAGCETRTLVIEPVEAPEPLLPGDLNRDGGSGEIPDAEILIPDGAPVGDCQPRFEICNGIDDDCDGLIDDGFDFFNDPDNCGRCGNSCSFDNAASLCVQGSCSVGLCEEGFVDLDGIDVNGCECELSAGGVEICDDIDNDCDGLVDEDFDLASSLDHCGACNRGCAFDQATAVCVGGLCQLQACAEGFIDLDSVPQNGCEYACVVSNGGVEICDGRDNDCNGRTDESDPRVGQACFPDGVLGCDPESDTCLGVCALGTWACLPGGLTCQSAALPTVEICDGFDNDCDGTADEDFDLQNDPRWCGTCGTRCELDNAVEGCSAGVCTVAVCLSGFVDLDGQPGNGCEYACTPDGPEVCDGRDNDCDGATDEADSDLRFPPTNFCNQVGECGQGPGGSARYPGAATYPVCIQPPSFDAPDWFCNYPNTVQLFAPNQVLGQETFCDGLDNDCDGATDEHIEPAIGSSCTDDGLGECQKEGVLRCQANRESGPRCDVSAAPDHTLVSEICDGKDNDCDGHTDEPWDNPAGAASGTCSGLPCQGVRDETVHVTAGGNNYWIFASEASRPDASETEEGTADARACSTAAGRTPWTRVDYQQATDACEAAGMRLCRVTRAMPCSSSDILEDEWGFACESGAICPDLQARPYPYGCSYDATACNGLDVGMDAPRAFEAGSRCLTGDLDATTAGTQAARDLSGNVAEWTDDCRGLLTDGSNRRTYTLRGGSFLNIPRALRCDFTSLVVATDFSFSDTGFRCCSSCPPGQADCDGACVDLASSDAHCGGCGRVCESGTMCSNGTCE